MQSFVSKTRADASLFTVCIVGAILAACSIDGVGPDAGSVETVVVAPPTATVSMGASLTLNAEARDANGTVLTSQRISWASGDPSIAEVSSSGVVTGRKIGTVLIAASARGKDAFASVTVNPTPVATVRLSLTYRSMLIGEQAQLTAEALDAGGSVLSGRPITWTTNDASIATVTGSGLVTAVSVGGAIITASAEGQSAVASITVSAVPVATVTVAAIVNALLVGQTTQLTVQLLSPSGDTLTGRPVVWSTSASTVATVSSDGLVTAVGQGTATITATSEGKSASVTISVTPRPASAVIVSPGQVTMFPGQSIQLSAIVIDDRGQVLTGKVITFSSSNVQVATVSTQGVVTGIVPGTATITAVSEGTTGTALVTVSPRVASVSVTPGNDTATVGQTVLLTATPRDANGTALTGLVVGWSSSNNTIATVSAGGLVTAVAPGTATITATCDGQTGSSIITVTAAGPGPVASIIVSPSSATVNVAWSTTLTATARDANGTVITGASIAWSTGDAGVATVSSSGVVTGVSPGSTTITATSGGVTGTASITVQLAPVDSIAVTPSNSTIDPGQTVQLTATLYDLQNNVLTGLTVTWSSSDATKVTVDSNGLATGVRKGTVTITASSGGKSGLATVKVR